MPNALKLFENGPIKTVSSGTQTAAESIGVLAPGCRIFGLTKGQFSMIDLLKATLEQTGPAHVAISTWTTGIRDVDNVGIFTERGMILSLQLLIDRSFTSRKPDYCRRVVEVFGPGAIRITSTHSKFAVIHNEQWAVSIRSSMNLNRNPRFEQYDLDENRELADFILGYVDEIGELSPPGLYVANGAVERAFVDSLGGGVSSDYPGLAEVEGESEDAAFKRIFGAFAARGD